jgi:hypothetical protein
MTAPRFRKLARRSLAAILVAAAAFVGWRYATGNFGTLIPGQVFRSRQLSASGLTRTIQTHRIRTVLNLRGCNPDQAWYRAEHAATLGAGATQIDVPLASDQWLSRAQARTLLEILDTAQHPLLIHCQWGSERTGLVSAFVELMRPGGSIASAQAQFSPYYLYLPTPHGRVMSGHIDRYVGWLRARGLAHTPERFRRWIDTEYHPGIPSRENWPCDPLPLKVVSRPGEAAIQAPAGVAAQGTRR